MLKKLLPDVIIQLADFLTKERDKKNLLALEKALAENPALLAHYQQYKKLQALNGRLETLFRSAAEPDVEEVKSLLDQGASPNLILPNPNADSLLHQAAHYDWQKIASLLLSKGANPLTENNMGKTPFMTAITRAHAYITYCMIPEVDKIIASQLNQILPWGACLKLFTENGISAEDYAFNFNQDNAVYLSESLFWKAINSGQTADWQAALAEDTKPYSQRKRAR